MITYKQLVEKKLTNAEKRKREEIAKAIERDTPDMAMDKKMAIATATAKRVAEADEKDPEEYDNEGSMMKGQLRQICSANEKLMKMVKDEDNLPEWVQSKVTKATDYIRSVRDYLESEKMEESTKVAATNESTMVKDKSADKKAELVTLPTGKRVVRMVPTQKKQVAESLAEGVTITLNIDTDTSEVTTENNVVEKLNDLGQNLMVQHLEELTAAEKKLVNQMYDKKGNLTPLGQKVMQAGRKK